MLKPNKIVYFLLVVVALTTTVFAIKKNCRSSPFWNFGINENQLRKSYIVNFGDLIPTLPTNFD